MGLRALIGTTCAATLLAGCAGGAIEPAAVSDALRAPSSAAPTVRTHDTHHRVREKKATLVIAVRVPHRHRAHYISQATKGMSLAFIGPKNVTEALGLTPQTDPRCSNAGGTTTCRISVDLPSGSYVANVSTYNEPPAGGSIPSGAKLLSTAGGVAVNVVAGKANQANFTLEGVPAKFAIENLPTGAANTAFPSPQPFNVTVKDASGYTIVGTYDSPVNVNDSDTSGATTIATSGSDKPPAGTLLSSTDTVTLNYTGLAIAPATISASASGATTEPSTFTPVLQSIGPTARTGGVFINSYGAASPVTFDASETGWTNAPYSKSLTATLSAKCSNFVSVTPSHGTTFTATLVQSPTNDSCTLTLSDGAAQTLVIPLGYERFGSNGSSQSFVVPSNVTTTIVTVAGAAGGAGADSGPAGGQGGIVSAALTVLGGYTFDVEVGGQGGNGSTSTPYSGTGGYNGGAIGSPDGSCGGGGGGGASDIRYGGSTLPYALADRILVAGGGGGSACFSGAGAGGAGGSNTFGGSGANGTAGATADTGGGGGGPSNGGSGGTSCNSNAGTGGGLGIGGEGATGGGTGSGAGGGGGGLYGGGGGGSTTVTGCTGDESGGGGGGSSYVPSGPSLDGLTTTQGGNAGSGYVIFVW